MNEEDPDDQPPRRPRARRANSDPDDAPPRRRYRDEDDDLDDPYHRRPETDATGGLIPYKNPKALTAYYTGVFGLISIVLCLGIFGVVPIVFGVMGLKYAKKHPEARGQGHAITGIVLGIIEVLCFLGVIVFAIVSAIAR
jgi:hypothetical protein